MLPSVGKGGVMRDPVEHGQAGAAGDAFFSSGDTISACGDTGALVISTSMVVTGASPLAAAGWPSVVIRTAA